MAVLPANAKTAINMYLDTGFMKFNKEPYQTGVCTF